MNQTYPMNGAVTDLNIWDRKLHKPEIREWSQFNSTEHGKSISWEEVKLGNLL